MVSEQDLQHLLELEAPARLRRQVPFTLSFLDFKVAGDLLLSEATALKIHFLQRHPLGLVPDLPNEQWNNVDWDS